jgi:hypothetical protein
LRPELNRTIERVLYIHSRAIPNFVCASAENGIQSNDLQEDFLPEMPVLYPNAPQFRDLSGDDATALIAFYDSLHALDRFVKGWWERDGQLRVNIFNQIFTILKKGLALALVCIQRFDLDTLYPPRYESWGTLTSRIERSLSSAKEAREYHIARFEAKNGRSARQSRAGVPQAGAAQRYADAHDSRILGTGLDLVAWFRNIAADANAGAGGRRFGCVGEAFSEGVTVYEPRKTAVYRQKYRHQIVAFTGSSETMVDGRS